MKKKQKVLVVDDDADLCNSIIQSLYDAGFDASGSTEISDAMFKLKNQEFACIILDMKIRNDSGDDILIYVRERTDSLNLTTPILVISGNLDQDILVNIAKYVQGVMVKPFNMTALLDGVKKAMLKSA